MTQSRQPHPETTMTRLTPNPHSPYATADPAYRHLVPSFLGAQPDPGVLALAACGGMTVVPEGTLIDATDALRTGDNAALPEGLCPTCVGVATGRIPEPQPGRHECDDCEGDSSHGNLCALCRQDAHELWWPTREEAQP